LYEIKKYFSLFSSTLITFLIQGALDGGLDIPHSENGFAGFSKEDKSLNAETHRKYILGGRIADYMKSLSKKLLHAVTVTSAACCLFPFPLLHLALTNGANTPRATWITSMDIH
jgi:hypothetical protein